MSSIKAALLCPSPTPITEIPGLYLSDITTPSSPSNLKIHGITHVLSIMSEGTHPEIPEDLGTTHKKLILDDDPFSDILGVLGDACAFIDGALESRLDPSSDAEDIPTTSPAIQAPLALGTALEPTTPQTPRENHVLVHCTQGISRSPALVIAYLMRRLNISYATALECVQAHRHVVFPNRGFAEQLELWGRMRFEVFERDAEGNVVGGKAGYRAWKEKREGMEAVERGRGRAAGMAALAARVGRRRMGVE